MKVAILGATGETGKSIVTGLFQSESPRYAITALTRPSSVNNPKVLELESKGVSIRPIDLDAPGDRLSASLEGHQIVICAISAAQISLEMSLVNAAKAAGVKRYVPCCFGSIMPPSGILKVRDNKEVIINHIKKLRLPYTVIDVGFWYQIAIPHLPSGRTNYIAPVAFDRITGDGNTPSGYTDLRDIGKWGFRILSDPRTINKMVFGFNAAVTTNQIYEALERVSGESLSRNYIHVDEIQAGIRRAEELVPRPDSFEYFDIIKYQYWNSLYIRGDNTPAYGKYLGYLDANQLYPDLKTTGLEEYIREALDGKVEGIYKRMVATERAAMNTQK